MRKITSLLLLLVLWGSTTLAQVRTVTGKVTDEKGDAVPFATIKVKSSKQGVSADANGAFSIKIANGTVVTVSSLGFASKDVTVDGDNISVTLTKTSDQSLSEVVVTTAFGIKKDQRTTPYSSQVVKAEALNIIPQTNLNDALAGKVAGVQFRSQSGSKLNSQSFARIRGGLALGGDVGAIYVLDGTIVGDGADIDPDNIESITILKGANATALFGSKAINGAIVVTSKKASLGRSIVNVSQGLTFDKVGRLPKLQNRYMGGASSHLTTYTWKDGDPEEWRSLSGKGFPDYTDDSSWGPEMLGQDYIPWYAWVPGTKYSGKTAKLLPQPNNIKDFWNTGVTSNTAVSFLKSGQGYNTRISYTRANINGIIPNSQSARNILSTVTSFDINKFVTAGIDFTYNNQKLYGAFDDGYANQSSGNFGQWNHRDLDMNIMRELRGLKTPTGTLASWNWAHNPDGYDATNPNGFFTGNYWYNFYGYQDNLDNQQTKDRLYGDAYIKVNISNDFSLKGTVRRDQYAIFYENIVRSILEKSGSQTGTKASYASGQFNQAETNYELLATYNHTFLKNLAVSVIGGGNINTYLYKSLTANTSNGLTIPDFYAISNSKSQPSVGNGRSESRTNSLFASADIEYNKWISATGSVRQDWASTLPTKNNLNKLFYPSAGVAFIPTELIKGDLPNWFSFGKVFGSWGQKPVSLGIYQNNFGYNLNQYQWNGNILLTANDILPDPSLKGSLITTFEIGTELRFLKNRFGLNITYYNETNAQQPVTINVDAVSGFTGKVINTATVKRQGLEFTLNGTLIKTKDFTWTATKTFGWLIKNPVTKIVDGQSKIQPGGWGGAFGTNGAQAYQLLNQDWGQLIGGGLKKADNGRPLVDPMSGLYVTGDPQYNWGSIVPKITGGFQSLFTYKDVTLNVSLDYQFGGHFYSLTETWGMFSGLSDYTAKNNDRGKSVRDPLIDGGGVHVTGVSSDDGITPVDTYVEAHAYFQNFFNSKIADPFVHKLSYVKLRELSLGYNLPVKKWGVTSKWLQSANLSVVARNPWLIYSASRNFDPSEISNPYGEDGQLPPVRSLGFNLSVKF